jgi:PAS domain S-box-containing protein
LLGFFAEPSAREATHQMEAQDQKHPGPTPASAHLRHILDGAGEAILVTDESSGLVVDANETACRWLRMTRGQLVARHLSDLPLLSHIHVEQQQRDTFTDTRRTPRPRQLNHGVVRRKDGTTFPVEITMVRRRAGDRDYVLTVARDITARGPLEDALNERDALYRSLLELSRDAVFVCSRGGLVSHANVAAAKLFGYAPIEFLGLDARLLFAGADELYRFQGAVFESGIVRDLPLRMRGKDGGPIGVLLTGAVRRDSDGAVLDYQCTVRREGERAEVSGRTAADLLRAPETPPEPDEPDGDAATVAPETTQREPAPKDVADQKPEAAAASSQGAVTELRAELLVSGAGEGPAGGGAPPPPVPARRSPATGHAIVRIADLGLPAAPPAARYVVRQRDARAAPAAPSGARPAEGQHQARRRYHAAAQRPRPQRPSTGPRTVYAASATPEGSHVPLWTATACVGAAITVVGWADLALLWFPMQFGRPEWEFATIGAHFDHMALGTLGVLLLALGIAHRGWWAPAQALAMASQLIAIGLVAVYAIFIVAAPQAWHNLAPQLEPTIDRAVRKVSVFAVGYVAAYTGLAVYLWRKAKSAQDGTA